MKAFLKKVGARVDLWADGDLQIIRGAVAVTVQAAIVLVALAIALSTILWFQARRTTDKLKKTQAALVVSQHAAKQSAIEACEASIRKGGVRYIIADNQVKQLARGRPLIKLLLPTATQAQRQQLLKQSEKQTAKQVAQLTDVDCSTGRAIPRQHDGP